MDKPRASRSVSTFQDLTGRSRRAITLPYLPREKQVLFHTSQAEVVFYGGAAGGGKSMALLMESLMEMLESPGNHGILFRRSYPELEKSLILESLRLFPREICKYNEIKHRWTIRTSGADSFLDFGFCKTEPDVFLYQSAQYGFMGFDESTHFTGFQIRYLMSRVRTAVPGIWPRIRMASNPGNIGHGWHKAYFGIGTREAFNVFTPQPSDEEPAPLSRCFIPATVYDNPYIMKHDPAYVSRLKMLPPAQRRMLLEGDWSSFAGKFFMEFSESRHMCPAFEIPAHWKKWRCVDYGFQAPFVCLWIAHDPISDVFYVYRECYQSGLKDSEQAEAILLRTPESEKIEYTVCDPSMTAKRGGTGSSPQENYAGRDLMLVLGNRDRLHGWNAVRELLSLKPDGKPRMKIFSSCRNLQREIEEAVTDSRNAEDVDTDGSDHAIDALRYFACSRPEVFRVKEEKEEYPGLDEGSKREWRAFSKMIKKMDLQKDDATLYNLNRE